MSTEDLAKRLEAAKTLLWQMKGWENKFLKDRLFEGEIEWLIAVIELQAEQVRVLREACSVILEASIDDFGDPDDYPEDDGHVGGGLAEDGKTPTHMAITFVMIRNLRAALAATETDHG